MAVTKIVLVPDEVLTSKCREIKEITNEVVELSQNLLDTIRDPNTNGVGLAAPQIGTGLSMCVVLKVNKEQKTEFLLINPVITRFSNSTQIDWEGCLSIPDSYCRVQRSKEIIVEYVDLQGKKVKMKATGFFARVIQHEVDHLNGVLITDKCIGNVLTEKELDQFLKKEKDEN